MKRLIINADDFGLTRGVNRAILELNQAGAVTSATLMANGPAFVEAVHAAFVQTTLGIGCHVVLVDGVPLLRGSEVPSLMDPAAPKQFRSTLGSFAGDLLRGRIRESEIEQEAIAQIRRLQSSGLTVTHVDTHKHTHMFARVLRPLLRAALACGVPAIRNPFEPRWSLRATVRAGLLRRMQVGVLGAQRSSFLRMTSDAGIGTTQGSVGVLATGTLDSAVLERLLQDMPAGTWELVCHPGYRDQSLEQARTRLVASREVERNALAEVVPRAVQTDPSLSLIQFGALERGRSPAPLLAARR